MFRISTLIWLVLTIITGSLLFGFGQKAEDERHAILRLERQIKSEQQNMDILNAEWSYLNRPSRLRDLSEKQLKLKTVDNLPVIEDETVEYLSPPPPEVEETEQVEIEEKDNGNFALSTPAPSAKPEPPDPKAAAPTPEPANQKSFDDVLKSIGIE